MDDCPSNGAASTENPLRRAAMFQKKNERRRSGEGRTDGTEVLDGGVYCVKLCPMGSVTTSGRMIYWMHNEVTSSSR